MSVENVVIVNKDKMVSLDNWREAIYDCGFELDIADDFDLIEKEGLIQCRYKGESSSFEYYFDELDQSDLDGDEKKVISERQHAVVFVTFSEYKDYISSMIAACVLCKVTDGLFLDGGEMPFILADEAVKWAKDCEMDLQDKI